MVSYYWPPCGGPGSLRPVKFAKHLPRFGIQPLVLTRRTIAYHSLDRELGRDVEGVPTFATESLDPARLTYLLGLRRYRPRGWESPIKKALNFPDNKAPWIPFAYFAALAVEHDAVLVTGPPFSSFIAGYLASRRTGKPLILDFRDAWLEFPFQPYTNRLEKRLVAYWERKLTAAARAITVVDENIRDLLIKKYPALAPRISVLPNGYDPDDFQAVAKPGRFTIAYIGTIRPERDPSTMLRAVAELVAEGRIPESGVDFKFIGQIEDRYQRAISRNRFARMLGHVSYRSALREFCASHLAVLITRSQEHFFPSRQLEYLASGLPIVVCGRSAGAHRLTEAFHRGYPGWTFDYDDVQGMKERIFNVYGAFRKGAPIAGQTPFPELTRQNLSRKLAGIVRNVVRE